MLNRFRRYGLPLYLKLAVRRNMIWKSSTDPDNFFLPPETSGMIRRLLRHLSLEANQGQVFVSRSLGYADTERAPVSCVATRGGGVLMERLESSCRILSDRRSWIEAH